MVTQLRELEVDVITRGHLSKGLDFVPLFVHRFARERRRALGDGRLHVRSAGSEPADRINPAAVIAMSELGTDIGKEFPRPMSDEVVRATDAVITMGWCGDACPIDPGKRCEDWEVDDPAETDLGAVRRIRDDIAARVRRLPDEIVSETD